jgi:hypothetical protein
MLGMVILIFEQSYPHTHTQGLAALASTKPLRIVKNITLYDLCLVV